MPDEPGKLYIHQFAAWFAETGCRKAHTLDGELVNDVLYGRQRPISDIDDYATAAGG